MFKQCYLDINNSRSCFENHGFPDACQIDKTQKWDNCPSGRKCQAVTDGFETNFEHEIICPYCGEAHDGLSCLCMNFQDDRDEEKFICNRCEKEFLTIISVAIRFSTEQLPDKGENHRD